MNKKKDKTKEARSLHAQHAFLLAYLSVYQIIFI